MERTIEQMIPRSEYEIIKGELERVVSDIERAKEFVRREFHWLDSKLNQAKGNFATACRIIEQLNHEIDDLNEQIAQLKKS